MNGHTEEGSTHTEPVALDLETLMDKTRLVPKEVVDFIPAPLAVNFNKQMRLDQAQHEKLLQLKDHCAKVYLEDVSLTWLVYKILDDYFQDPKKLTPSWPVLDNLAKSRPHGKPMGGVFSDLETFLVMTRSEVVG